MKQKEQKFVDPVCGMEVDPEKTSYKTVYKGKTYYFCALGCKTAFEEDPEKYLEEKNKHEHKEHH